MENQKFIKRLKYFNFENKYQSFNFIKKEIKDSYFITKYYNYLFLIILLFLLLYSYNVKNELNIYKKYINECKELKRFNITKIYNENPFLSICLPVYNMEKYIERAILSIINQSFQNFEIVIVNDNSNDNTENIIKRLKLEDNRIKIIKHIKNLGVYSSRVEAILNAKGEYIIVMDPDDMFLNPELFKNLYNFNLNYNLDIIEFTVYHQNEGKKTIFLPNIHDLNHYHKYKNDIIYQPYLSDIIFYEPNTFNYSSVICRTIWNKLIKKNILLNSINYLEKEFKNKYLITADDTPLNMLNFHFANNYSNINLPGYLYNVRKRSMSRGNNGKKHELIVNTNYLLYFKLFYKYLKDFKKDLNYLYYDMKIFSSYLINFKKFKDNIYINNTISFLNEILNNTIISKDFEKFIRKLLYCLT